jgi:hypothetical protein
MAASYTSNIKLAKPAVADRNWNLPLNANADLLDGLAPIGGLCVTPAEVPSASLEVRVAAGRFRRRDGTIGSFDGAAAVAVPPETTSVVFLNDDGSLMVAPAFPATAHVPLAAVVAGPSAITAILDHRVVCGVVGSDSAPYLPLSGGTLAEGANLSLGTAQGTRIGTSASQKLGFWNAAPTVRPAAITQQYVTSSRTLAAYTPAVQATPFGGINNAQSGTPYAQVGDLNSLRAAYENLRFFTENLAQVLNTLINDLRSTGLAG